MISKKIRRTKLCVLISIAVPSYLMLSANILTSVVNFIAPTNVGAFLLYRKVLL